MKILICGDVVGKSGRTALSNYLPNLRRQLELDFVVVNGENAAHGFGITEKICQTFIKLGVDAITTGNHVWDQRQILNYIDKQPRLLRPLNFPVETPGRGFGVFKTMRGQKILVINLLGQLFMGKCSDPFLAIEDLLKKFKLGRDVSAIIVDFHGEATSEKQALAQSLDGRVSIVVGTHTHVPTADHQILKKGCGFQSDIGMTGDYDSIIGMKKAEAINRFKNNISGPLTNKGLRKRLEPADGEATLCGVFFELNENSGSTAKILPIRVGGRLTQTIAPSE